MLGRNERALGDACYKKTIVFVFVIFCVPSVACADVGTPLVWATTFHLLIGNAVLGLLEGWWLASFFNLARGKCIAFLILANYLSTWIGCYVVDRFRLSQVLDVYNAQDFTLGFVLLCYLLTLLIEWPLVALCFYRKDHWFARSMKANLLVQTMSYLFLFGGFWMVSGKSLYSDFTIVAPDQILLPAGITVYYLSREDGHVYSRAQQGEGELCYDVTPSVPRAYLKFLPSGGGDLCDLILDRGSYTEEKEEVILPNLIRPPEDDRWWRGQTYYGWGDVPRIGDAIGSPWLFSWGHWASIGLMGENSETKERINVSYGTPFIRWEFYRAIHLSENIVLFQLGEDQLCLLEIDTKRISLWGRGYGVVAIADEDRVYAK
ncbi:MAG: hypothetical protein L3J39_17780 [Verrucomicrobiales bacterium]|nr:hypothetical protein [Verrucomicrobiales bacterium]